MSPAQERHDVTLSPIGLIAVGVLLAIGWMGLVKKRSQPGDQLAKLGFIPITTVDRVRGQVVEFNDLGFGVRLPESWWLLSTGYDQRFSPTFVHGNSGCMIRVRDRVTRELIARQESMYSYSGDSHVFISNRENSSTGAQVRYRSVTIDWVSARSLSGEVEIAASDPPFGARTTLGRFSSGKHQVAIEVLRMGREPRGLSFGPIAEFCDGLEPLADSTN